MTEENKIDEIDEKLDKTEDYGIIINLLYQKVDLLESIIGKKNRIINEMAEHIVSSAIVDDTICGVKFCEIQEDCTHEKMLNCTKQYFENKVKDF